MIDHIEVAIHILDAIAMPLRQFIDHSVCFYGDDSDYTLIQTLDKHPVNWVMQEPYNEFGFEMDHAKETFLSLSNVFEIAHGSLFADLFLREVGAQLKVMIIERISFYMDVKARENQEEYNHDFRGDAA